MNMLKRWLVLLLVIALGIPHSATAADTVDADLATGVRQAQEGDFENAVVTLDGVVRRLTGQPARAKDLARAYTYLSIAYLGLSQEQTAKAKFLEAWKADRDMNLSPREFPPRILEFFERARKEANLGAPVTAASPQPAAAPAASPEPKKKGSKTIPILIGAGVLAGVGVAVAAGGGGGGGGGTTPSPAPASGPLAFRLSWSVNADLDLHVIEPNGTEISFLNTTSSTGGHLDSDVGCGFGTLTETISWTGTAPRGTYVTWAVFSPTACGGPTTASVTLTISQGNNVLVTRTGTLNINQESERVPFVF
jgi:hypothetical protein